MKWSKHAWISDDLVFQTITGHECFPHAGKTIVGSAAAKIEIVFRSRDDILKVLKTHRRAIGAWWSDAELAAVADFYDAPAPH